jgi:hypothetical protein
MSIWIREKGVNSGMKLRLYYNGETDLITKKTQPKTKSVDHENEVNIWSMSRPSMQTLIFMEMEPYSICSSYLIHKLMMEGKSPYLYITH